MKKVVCVGEMLIDFVCTDTLAGLQEGNQFVKKSGGAPANVAACIGKLGGQAVIVGSVGNDPFGGYLINEMHRYQVNTDFVEVSEQSTTLAFVSLSAEGERDFAFNRGADETLSLSTSSIDTLLDNSILHLGSATALLGGPLSISYLNIAKAAKQKGNLICFDPNYRIDLWQGNLSLFRNRCETYLELADVVKVSEEEMQLLSQHQDFAASCDYFHQLGVKILLVTLGSKGCFVSQSGNQYLVPAYKTEALDTTGAGDSFIGAMLFQMATHPMEEDFYTSKIETFVKFSEKVSSLVCTKLGAMTALPTQAEVNARIFNIN